MKWKQEFEIPQKALIDHHSTITAIGSCFSNNMGQQLHERYMDVLVNPLGILYNPVSVETMISRAIKGKAYTKSNATSHLGTYHLLELHGSRQHTEIDILLESANQTLEKLGNYIRKSDVIFLTYGTSIVFRYKPGGFIAGNNHKLPLEYFEKQLLPVTEVKSSIVRTIREIRRYNPKTAIILTVSPVRHLRNGTVDNQLSKSTLLVAAHEALSEFRNVYYFPAYEIMMDELRDYRFYAKDLVHPSEEATEYVWERLMETHFSGKARLYVRDIDQYNAMVRHRPLFPGSPEHTNFLYKLSTFKTQVMSQWNINLPDETIE